MRTLAVILLTLCACRHASAGQDRTLAGWPERPYDVQAPAGAGPHPLLLVLHGGGGNKDNAHRMACPKGDRSSPRCLDALALARGYLVVYASGTGSRLVGRLRTWNAGGGQGGLQCVSGRACLDGIDDVRYLREVLDDVARAYPVDPRRIYATGLSNGAAMSHRLGCALPGRLAAIAPVSGANQFAAAGGACEATLSVLEVHGTADPCWPFGGGEQSCIDGNPGAKAGAPASFEGWSTREGCSARVDEALPASASDLPVLRHKRTGCRDGVEVQLLEIQGGGHAWPGGHPFLGERMVGKVPSFDASAAILDFFDAHPRREVSPPR